MLTASDDVPCVFVPQPWNPARCRKCYKKEADHKRPEVAKSDVGKEPTKLLENNSETKLDVEVQSDKNQCDSGGNDGDVSAVVTIRTAPVESKWKSMQSDSKSLVSNSSRDSSSSLNSKASTQTNVTPKPTDSFTFNAEIEKCNSILEDYVQGKPTKKQDATSTTADPTIADKESKIVVEQLQAKLKEKENRCSQLEAENRTLLDRPPQFDKSMAEELIELRTKLAESESKYRTLLQENCMMKQEVYALQIEVDEMQDQFREEEAEEFKEIQKELEIAAKNCRILQYKLRKSEKRNDELESDRQHFEERLRELEEKTAKTEEERKLINELDEELIVAKEVSVRLHDELEASEERRAKVEEDYEAVQKQLADLIAEKQQLESEFKQKDKSHQDETSDKPAPLIMSLSTDPASGELQGKVSLKPQTGSLERTRSTDSESQLMRDLCETVERERDLREQLRFAENEAKELRKKVSQLENDNETMNLQLQKMASEAMKAPFRPGLHKKNIPQTSKASEDKTDDSGLDANELKLQIEVTEQENKVMRRKMLELEQELENRITEVTIVQEKLNAAISDKAKHSEPPPPSDIKPDAYYEQKLKILEDEVFQLRKKLVERERENERLSTSLGVELRKKKDTGQKTTKMFTRSRSLDSEHAEDDPEKENTIEKEISVMRNKLSKLETENEKLQQENRRLVMLHSRKIPIIEVDDQAQENIELTSKVQILENECTELEDKCTRLEDQLRKSRKGEQRAAKAVDKKEKTLEKMDSLELETSEALQQKVRDLQEEIEDLLVIVKGRESTNEQLEEELQTYKHEMQRATQDHKEKQDKLMEELKKALDNNADMALQLQIMVQRAEYAQKELDDAMQSRDQPPSTPERSHKQLERQSSSKYEKILSERVQVLEKQLAEEQLKLTMAEFKTSESNYSSMTDDARVQHIQNQKITQLEKQLSDQKQEAELTRKKLELEILALEQECSRFKHHSEAVTSKLEETAKIALESQDKYNSLAEKFNKGKVKWERERSEIESHFEQELKVRDQEIADKTEHVKLKDSELEEIKSLAAAKEANAEKSIAKIDTLEVNYRARLKEMSDLLVREREKHTILQQRFSRYEDAVKKEHATLAVARGQLENAVAKLKAEKEVLETDLRKVRDTYNSRQDEWIKEKLKKEEEVRSLRQEVLSQMKDANATPITASERQKLLDDIRRLEIQIDVSKESWTLEKQDLQKDLEQKTKFLKKHKSNEKKLQQEVDKLRSMLSDYERGKGRVLDLKSHVDRTPHEDSETLKQKLKAVEDEAKLYKEKFENLEKIIKQEETSGGGDLADKTMELKAKLAKLRMDFDSEKAEQRRHHDKARQEWIKEKVDLQFKLRELERDKTKLSLAQNRLKELESRHKHLQDTLRKERDELKTKLSESEEKRFYDKQEFSEFRNELSKIGDLAALKKLKLKINEKKPVKPSAEKPVAIEEKMERPKVQKPVETIVKKEAAKPQVETRKPVRDESWERDKIQLKKTLDEALQQISRVSEDLTKYQKSINEPNGSGELRKDRSHSCSDMPFIDSGLATVSEGGSQRIYFSWQDQTTSSTTPASDTDVPPERERGREGRGPTSLRKGHARSASADNKNQSFFRSVLGQWAEKTVSKIRSRSRSRSPSGTSLGDSDTDSIGSNPTMRLVFRKKHDSIDSPKLLPKEEAAKVESDSTLKKHKVRVKKKKDGADSKPRLIKSVSFDLATCPSSSEETAVLADDSRQRENINMMQKLRQVSFADKIENVETKTQPAGGAQPAKEHTSSASKLQTSSISSEYSIPMRRTGSKDVSTSKSIGENKTDDDKSQKVHTRSSSADSKTFSTTAKPSSVKSKVELWQSKFSSVPEKKKVITTRVGGSTMQTKVGTSSVQNLPTTEELKSITYGRPKLSTRSRSLDVDAP